MMAPTQRGRDEERDDEGRGAKFCGESKAAAEARHQGPTYRGAGIHQGNTCKDGECDKEEEHSIDGVKVREVELKRAVGKEVWIERRIYRVEKLGEAMWPGEDRYVKHDLSLVGMKAIALIPV